MVRMRPLIKFRKLHLLVAAAAAVLATAVFAATGSATPVQTTVGPYTVTSDVTQDAGAGTTTVTYTIFRPAGAPALNQVNVGIGNCHVQNNDITSISHSGVVLPGQDPSTKQQGPLIRWTSDLGARSGETVTETYTVQGLWDPSTDNTLGIKGGNDFSTGQVQGVGCNATNTPSTPGANNTPVGGNNVAGSQGVAGVQIALPDNRNSCVDTRKFKFRLHHAQNQPVVDVVVFINGKQRLHKHGANINAVTISKLPQGKFTVKVVAKQSSGSTLTSIRKYNGCKKGKPKTKGHHHHH